MNFLAHMYLSGDHPDIMIGNFIADHIDGNRFANYRVGIIRGIRLHRQIDTYTDTHPVFLTSKRRLQRDYHKYAGVIADMFYDHFLSAEWDTYSSEKILDFTNRRYAILMKNFFILPAQTRRILPFMIADNWLASYADLNFLQRSLRGMAMRTAFPSGMETAVRALRADYEKYHTEFNEFFGDMIPFAKEELKKLRDE